MRWIRKIWDSSEGEGRETGKEQVGVEKPLVKGV